MQIEKKDIMEEFSDFHMSIVGDDKEDGFCWMFLTLVSSIVEA